MIKLYLLTGFLGAGKTTLLKNLMELSANTKVGIIMNEFGKIGIDGKLVSKDGRELLEINNGSIFCSCLKGSFVQGLIDFSDLPVEVLFVEGSGLSDPSNMSEILELVHAKAGLSYEFMGSICVVDGVNFMKLLEVLPTLERQVAASHQIVINKIDLLTDEELEKLVECVKTINSTAKIIKTAYCKIEPSIFEHNRFCELNSNQASVNTPDNRPKTLTLKVDGVFIKQNLMKFLKSLSADLYRAKGFFKLEDGWYKVDMVGEQIVFISTEIRPEMSTLVLISSTGLSAIRRIVSVWDENFDQKMELR